MNNKTIFVTGGTGNVGGAIVDELINHHYQVFALCRSEESAERLRQLGVTPVLGNLNQPEEWLHQLDNVQAVIHTACSFEADMAETDRLFVDQLAQYNTKQNRNLTLVYTSGCWNYGNHQNLVTETSHKHSIADFQWMLDHIRYIKEETTLDLRIVSPTNVIREEEYYVPPILLWELERTGHPTTPKSLDHTWSLVERRNLAKLYRLVLEKGRTGEEYIGVDDPEVSLYQMTQAISAQTAQPDQFNLWRELYGSWTEGYELTQVFSSQKAVDELGWQPKPLFNKEKEPAL